MDYGLWLLVGLLVIIGLVFLLSGRSKADAPEVAEPLERVETVMPVADPLQPVAPVVAPVEIAPVTPVAMVDDAPVVAKVPEPVATSKPTPEPTVAPPAPVGTGDDLLKLKGVGPKLAALLTELGITRYAEIAGWSDNDIAAIDTRLGNFKGRPVRDQWVDQAKYLAAGDIAGFEAKYGKL